MSNIEQAIKLAVEGGWNMYRTLPPKNKVDMLHSAMFEQERTFLDPSFWQALGKAMGWEDHRCEQCHDVFPEYHNGCVRCGKSILPDQFNRYHWHRFINHLAEGKDAESFFAELLTTKK